MVSLSKERIMKVFKKTFVSMSGVPFFLYREDMERFYAISNDGSSITESYPSLEFAYMAARLDNWQSQRLKQA